MARRIAGWHPQEQALGKASICSGEGRGLC
jgi:hypothetical protein